MLYLVQIKDHVLRYIGAVDGLSDAGRAALIDGVIDELGQDADKFLERYPLGPESLHFRYDYPHPDGTALYVFDFIVDGSEMAVGVVSVVYVECTVHRAS